ncbi:MAG: hypothetical protein KFF68_05245 [Desulfosarcina sp.]|nr:hypothetical protein [Desulfosarcina sp.]
MVATVEVDGDDFILNGTKYWITTGGVADDASVFATVDPKKQHEGIWWLMTDARLWPLWGPSVRAVDCSDDVISSASTGRILTALGLWISFAVGEFEPGIYWD